jgi:signal transduction histidine kinase/CheY-like chemotaxis protein
MEQQKDTPLRHAPRGSRVFGFEAASRELLELKTRLEAELEAMTRLQQVGSLCAETNADFQECLGHLVEAAVALTGADKGNIQLLDEKTGSLKLAAHCGFSERFLHYFGEIRRQASICGVTLRSGQRTFVEDVSESPLFIGTQSLEVLQEEGVRAIQSTPLRSSTGRVLGMISTHCRRPRHFSETELRRMDILARQGADFVERKKREEAMCEMAREREHLLQAEQAARKEAERAGRLKDDFVATLSHELRTPIQAILGWAQILQRRQSPEDLRIGLETIERNARAQAQLISDLLDVSRIVSGKLRLDVQRVDLPAIIEEAIETIRPAAAGKEIRIRRLFSAFPGAVMHGDAGRLRQVVWNLLNNAVKFTPWGGNIRVGLERVERHVELSVSDTGTGIAPDFLPYIFERFRQGDTAANRRHGGLGLGLAIVKNLVEAHGGSVCVKSAGIGEGATFIVVLPVSPADAEDAEMDPAPEKTANPSLLCDVDLSRIRVLVVDDEDDTRSLLQRALEDAGASVVAAAGVEEALQEMTRQIPDVLISDLGMPGKSGFDLIRAVRSRSDCRQVPAVALTAFARAEDRTRAIMSGYQMHVPKPVEVAELCAVVASLTGRARFEA